MTFTDFLAREPEATRKKLDALFDGYDPTAKVGVALAAPGQAVMRQGDARAGIYILLSGRVDTVTQHAQYATYAFHEFAPIHPFGEMEVMAGLPTILADVRAKSRSRFLVLNEKDYLRWLRSDTDTMEKRMRIVLSSIIYQADRERNALFLSSDERLALFLADYYERHAAAGTPVRVRQSHGAIAEEIGFSLRTVNRCITRLVQAGTVGLEKGKMTISAAQYEALRKNASG